MKGNFYITISICARFKLEKKKKNGRPGGRGYQRSEELRDVLRVKKLHSGD